MSVTPGSTLLHFEISAKLGVGGMGEVWQARDTKLGRQVAIKVLSEAFTADPERLSRFQREAKVLASLEHSNIAAIYEIGEDDGIHFIAMQLAEGEDLAKRIARGPIPPEEAIPIVLQVAEALEAAHEKGIIHRDLKPANVMVTPASHAHPGRVTILDFGLAKALESDPGPDEEPSLSQAPTLTDQMTLVGAIMGTAAYMSPEQARGHPVDNRTDIWGFGCLLYEMLAGRPLFSGLTLRDTLDAVRDQEIDLDTLPARTPESVQRLLQRCLARDPRQRLHHMADARLELQDTAPAAKPRPTRAPVATWSAAALVAVVLAIGSFLAGRGSAPATLTDHPPHSSALRAIIPLPEDIKVEDAAGNANPPAVSPDGRHVAFSVSYRSFTERTEERVGFLYEFATGRSLELAREAWYPFWSPDGGRVAFLSPEMLFRVDLDGDRMPVKIRDAKLGYGGAWREDGTILFATGPRTGIHRVDARGGVLETVTEIEPDGAVDSHRYPVALPGERFLYLGRRRGATARHEVHLATIDGREDRMLLEVEAGLDWADGFLFYLQDGTLVAHSMDLDAGELIGNPLAVVSGVEAVGRDGLGLFSVSAAGPLTFFESRQGRGSQLSLVNRRGELVKRLGQPAEQAGLQLAPDGSALVVNLRGSSSGFYNLWLYDLERGVVERLTGGNADHKAPVWSPDGKRIAYSRFETSGGETDVEVLDLETGAVERIASSALSVYCGSWSPESMTLVCERNDGVSREIVVVSLADGEIEPLIAEGQLERHGQVSPDGRWLAYTARSDLSGAPEVYLTSFPRPGRRWQVSKGGGTSPRWRRDGGELYYIDGANITAVSIRLDRRVPELGVPQVLFSEEIVNAPGYDFDVNATGELFAIHITGHTSRLTVVSNWRRLLQEP